VDNLSHVVIVGRMLGHLAVLITPATLNTMNRAGALVPCLVEEPPYREDNHMGALTKTWKKYG
jgi:hypothetical protein